MKLLRVEGVNLAQTIDDTENLSTRRGGSLMLLDAINDIAVKNPATLRRISTGASTGLFEVMDDANVAVEAVKHLLAGKLYCHGTFVVDVIDIVAEFPESEIAALAANRWRQMRSLSVSSQGLSPGKMGVCEVDEVRPASKDDTGKPTRVSASVQARRSHGVTAKHQFYRRILGDHHSNAKFTNDFESIATGPAVELTPKTLEGKIAVFYADGNGFGNIARACKTPQQLVAWDDYITAQRKNLLKHIRDVALSKRRWQTKNDALRLETLLWGGDELMFVVPGWCGLELAQLFFEQTATMRYPDTSDGKDLTHACGLVFCHHQAPISRISKLAKALAEQGKSDDRRTNSLNWLVLESFDHTGSGLGDYLARQFPAGLSWPDLALNPKSLAALTRDFAALKANLPRSAIVHIARTMAEGRAFDGGKEHPLVRSARQQVAKAGGAGFLDMCNQLGPKATERQNDAASPDDMGVWIKLAELWDYCPAWDNATQGEQA